MFVRQRARHKMMLSGLFLLAVAATGCNDTLAALGVRVRTPSPTPTVTSTFPPTPTPTTVRTPTPSSTPTAIIVFTPTPLPTATLPPTAATAAAAATAVAAGPGAPEPPPSALPNLRFIVLDAVPAGGRGEAAVQTNPNVDCAIRLILPDGSESETFASLRRRTGPDGIARWLVEVRPDTRPGVGQVSVTCSGQTIAAPFVVRPRPQ